MFGDLARDADARSGQNAVPGLGGGKRPGASLRFPSPVQGTLEDVRRRLATLREARDASTGGSSIGQMLG